MSVTLQFQSTGAVPSNARPVRMVGQSLTIGRGPDNDLVLPDPDRMVSKTHCVIEDHGGRLFAIDLSTNGTFLNYSKVPMGREPTAINDGDVLSLGPYELVVQVSSMADDLLPPVDIGPASHGRAGAAPDPLRLLDDAPPGMDFLDNLLGDGPKGPKQLKMGQFDPDALLPPLDEDEPFLGRRPQVPDGPAMRDHSPSVSDAFRPAQPGRSVIPDDWEDDLLSPAKPAGGGFGSTAAQPVGGNPFGGNPFGSGSFGGAPFTPPPAPPSAMPPAAIPDDFDDLIAPVSSAPPAAVQPAAFAAPEPPPVPEAPVAPAAAGAPIPFPVNVPPPEALLPAPPESSPVASPAADYVRPTVNPFVTVPPVANVTPASSDPFADIAADAIDGAEASAAPLTINEPPPVATPESPAVAPQTLPRAASGAEAEAIAAFLEGLGMADLRLGDAELVLTMGRLGATLREMIVGLREILMTRSSIKSEFRIDQTMITAGKNNPLKFSISPELAVEAMAKSAVKGYLEADEAARQALDDIKAHEIGMVTGMEAALKGVLARLDPAELTTKIEGKGGLGAMFRGKKALYWETYEKMYAEISDQAENDFHDLFAREFAQAYKEQLKRLKEAKG